MPIYSLARREFENPREFGKISLGLRPRKIFPNSLGFRYIPSGRREYMGIFPQKTRISNTIFFLREFVLPREYLGQNSLGNFWGKIPAH